MKRKVKRGQTLEQQCAEWAQLAGKLDRRTRKLERAIREALDGLHWSSALAEILRRGLGAKR